MNRRTPIELLERRVLLAAEPVAIEVIDGARVATIEWQNEPRQALAGRWIVQFDGYDGYLLEQQARLGARIARARAPFHVITHMSADGMFLIQAPEQMAPDQVVARASALPGLRAIGPDFFYATQAVPNDAQFVQQWGMHNTGQSGGVVDADIDAPEAWDATTGSSGVVVGMVDLGIDYNHPELADNIWTNTLEVAGNNIDDDANGFIDDVRGWDWWGNGSSAGTPDNDPTDQNNHGTHTAGIVGARGDNAVGVAGVNWNVKLMALKVGGPGTSVSGAAAVSAMNYVLAMKNRATSPVNVRVTNHSYGGGGFDAFMNDALAQHAANDLLAVCAAGNNNSNNDTFPFYPASYNQPNVISVGAHTRSDVRASFSNYGPITVDLFAPGGDIRSTIRGGSYLNMSGTSMAAPHVTGTVALMNALLPNATFLQVRNALWNGVVALPAYVPFCATTGRVNARGAVDMILRIPPVPAAPDLAATSDHGQFNNDNVTNDNTPTFTGAGAVPGNVIRIVTGGFQVGGAVVAADGTWGVTTVPLDDGVRQFTARQENGWGTSGHSPPLTVAIDTLAPVISNPQFYYAVSPHVLRLSVSENVGWSVAPADFELANLTNPGTVNVSPAFQPGANLLTLTFPGVPVLPDARHRLTVRDAGPGEGVRDVAGNAAAQFADVFTFLRGDANGDGRVNLQDFNILAANFGQSPRDFTQGDFNYDDVVNLQDFNVLAGRFGQVVAAAAVAAPAPREGDDHGHEDDQHDDDDEALA